MTKVFTPKSITFICAFLFFTIIVKKSVSDSGGPSAGLTGAPGEGNCTSCHSSTSVNSGNYLNNFQVITNMPNGRYALNTTYAITVRLVTPNCSKFGFQATMLNTSNVTVGNMAVPTGSTRVQKLTSGSKQYIEHTSGGTSAIYTDSTEWTFNWTSPPTASGTLTLYVAGNVTNSSSTYFGDSIYTKSWSFQQYTPPTGSISTNTSTICINDSIRFTGSGTNSPTGYSWTFPGGVPATSTLQQVWVKFPNTGSPVCSLYVTNTSGTSPLVTRTVSVNSIPTASITAGGSTTFCSGDSVQLNANTGTGYTYLWYLDGVSTGKTTNPFYAKVGGNYTVRVTGPGGCGTTSSPVSVTVNPTPSGTIAAMGPTTFCAGDSVLIKLTGTPGVTRVWYNGITPITGVTDTFYYAKTNGTYSVKLATGAGCNATSNTINVLVNTYPTASFTSTPSGCLFILTANSGTGYKYQWFRNDTALVNDTNINYTINANGSYKVRVTNPGGCAIFSSAQTVNITNLPDVTLTVTGNPTFCIGDSVVLSVPQNGSYSYKWFKGANPLINDTLNTLTVKDSGTYLVRVSNVTCTNISNATQVIVLAYPDAGITGNKASFCNGDSALLTAKTGVGLVYKWFRNDTMLTGETNPTLLVKTSGSYHVNISNGYCNQNGNKTTITVFPLPPAPVITRNGHALTSTTAATYQWYRNDTLLIGAQAQSFAAGFIEGKYKVAIVDMNGCKNISAEFDYSLVGIKDPYRSLLVKVYPNPADHTLYIDCEGDAMMKIFDACGKLIMEQAVRAGSNAIPINNLSDGAYMIRIAQDDKSKMLKFMVGH